MQEFFYQGIKRLDWGFGNPNITAGLIATLLMAVWGLAFIHRWGFWPALLGFTTLGVCLIQTVSRGGLVAAILGGFVLGVLESVGYALLPGSMTFLVIFLIVIGFLIVRPNGIMGKPWG